MPDAETKRCPLRRRWLPLAAISLPLFLLDQGTKWWVLSEIPLHGSIPVIPGFFNLTHCYNTGAAFGLGQNNNLFFLLLSAAAFLGITAFWMLEKIREIPTRFACALLLAGIAGNLLDRILHGHVVDFLDFVLPWYGVWPAFNVADSCICVAAATLVVASFFSPPPPKKSPPAN